MASPRWDRGVFSAASDFGYGLLSSVLSMTQMSTARHTFDW